MIEVADRAEFLSMLGSTGLEQSACDSISRYRDLIIEENERQNLTRITGAKDFFEGMVLDCLELKKSGLMTFKAMDLGSGAGIPGILCALLGLGPWVLAESEGHKAEFLRHAVSSLRLSGVDIHSGRAEDFLRKGSVETIVAKAVGPVERIFGWIGQCSTWNNLVLLKGPRWEEEWNAFRQGKNGRKLEIGAVHEYSVGEENKRRMIIRLDRRRILLPRR